jgi:hypothetical protein
MELRKALASDIDGAMCYDMRENLVIKIKSEKMENNMAISLNALVCSRYLKTKLIDPSNVNIVCKAEYFENIH